MPLHPVSPLLVALAWVGLTSLAALLAVGSDKRRARRRGPRISERTLLLLALLGGTPGLLLGMFVFGHKIRKLPFLGKALLVALFQSLLLLGLLGGATPP